MCNKDVMQILIDNLNEDGLKLLADIFGDIWKNERFNKNTTPERLIELQQIESEKEVQRKKQSEADESATAYEKARAEYERIREYKDNLSKKDKRLLQRIDSVVVKHQYSMNLKETELFSNIYNNNLINGSYDLFRYGFMRGQLAERHSSKKVAL